MLWAPGFWIWEGATGDFTMAPTSARRHGTPTNPHLLAAAVAPALKVEKRREPLRHRRPDSVPTTPPTDRIAGRNRVSCNFIIEPSPAQPRPPI